MLISKFNLYRSGWLELVFENRNKSYGAYELRQHYAANLSKAMLIAFAGVATAFTGAILLLPHTPIIKPDKEVVVTINPDFKIKHIKEQVQPEFHHLRQVKPPKPAPAVATQPHPQFVVKPDEQAKDPIKTSDMQKADGPATIPGNPSTGVAIPNDGTQDGGSTTAGADDKPRLLKDLDVMPAPVGGDAAWAKFLNKNLRYPAPAQEQGLSGKVMLSFIIEKDGHLSDIHVINGAGNGFDEEALRVLKLAKAWTPGKQNGQLVRVRYQIPINFQLAE